MAQLNQAKIIKGLEHLTESVQPETFFFDFLKLFGTPNATITALRNNNKSRNIALRPGDYGLTKKIYFRAIAEGDVSEALEALLKEEKLQQEKVRFFLVTDYTKLAAYDARVDDSLEIDLSDLRSNYDFFLPLTGQYEKPLAYSPHPADTKACEKMGRLYDIIKTLNHYDDSNLHDLNVFLTRLLFCFFAEDTGIFPIPGQMTQAMMALTQKDGSDLSAFFTQLFEVLDLPLQSPERQHYSATLQAFPYVNGGLFSESCQVPVLNARARNILIDLGKLTWSEISPVIFGSMFQSVMNPEQRHELGAHYTSEKNIFKVINPLFLDDLKAELANILELKLKAVKKRRLEEFQYKLSQIKIADPACGCGNFLVVAYRELKELELKAVEALLNLDGTSDRSIFMDDWKSKYSKVSINQFYGIEIEEFPVDIARVSMWLMEHVMNRKFGALLGQVLPSIPLRDAAKIVCANALTTNWEEVFPEDLTFIMGNPPFGGSSIITKEQKNELLSVFGGLKQSGILDFVTAWFAKAGRFIHLHNSVECAFVATNSISQGEQVAPLWGYLFGLGLHINFAHQTFQWKNEAKDNAGVYCVIVGFAQKERTTKKLFVYETPKSEAQTYSVKVINGYLLETKESVFVKSSSRALQAPRPMVYGNKPTDGGNLIIEAKDVEEFLVNSLVRPYVKKLIGSREFLHKLPRYCLWLVDASDEVLMQPLVTERIEACRQMRLSSRDLGCQRLAQRPYQFRDLNNPDSAIVIPGVSSERREYIPMGFISNDTIVTNLCHIVPNGTLYDFGVLESRMHMTWMSTVCGRLGNGYRYSRDLCYNTFPWPKASEAEQQRIENLAENVLTAREMHPDMTLAELYDPDKMPEDLRRAHTELDLAVEALYRKRPFANDEERLKHLFARYEKLTQGEDGYSLYEE